jgi:cation:H+ antiporter
MPVLILAVGLGITTLGAESFVAGACRLARALRVPPILIGLTVVSLGTSAPEMAVALSAVTTDHPPIALGNIVGSNICNVLLILGLAAVITPLRVAHRFVRFDIPVMILASVLVFSMTFDGRLERLEGGTLLMLAGLYVAALFRARSIAAPDESLGAPPPSTRRSIAAIMVLAGALFLFLGARLVVSGATDLARALGATELVVGLTILAFGTSLPELATTLSSLRRSETDLVVGNIVGSNVVNLLVVLGLTAVATDPPLSIPIGVASFDFPILCVVAFACLPVFFTKYAIERWEGVVFLCYYAIYLLYIMLDQSGHATLALYRIAMFAFVGPLAVLTLAVVLRGFRRAPNAG